MIPLVIKFAINQGRLVGFGVAVDDDDVPNRDDYGNNELFVFGRCSW